MGQMGCCLAAGVAVPAVDELLSQAAYMKPETIPKYYTQLQHGPCQDQVPSSKLATCSRHGRLLSIERPTIAIAAAGTAKRTPRLLVA